MIDLYSCVDFSLLILQTSKKLGSNFLVFKIKVLYMKIGGFGPSRLNGGVYFISKYTKKCLCPNHPYI